MDQIFELTLAQIGGASVLLSGLAGWLGKVWKDRIHLREKAVIDIDIAELKAEHARKAQSLEHELQLERHAAQLGHANLIEKRATIIDENYKLLVDLHEAIFDTIRPDYFGREKPSKSEAYNLALPKFDLFMIHFEKNKIYFSKEVAKNVSGFYVAAAQALDQARLVINSNQSLSKGITPELQKLFMKVDTEMGKARVEVEKDFRKILRVNEA
ncbi:hypothetical protein NMR92_004012 [Vibrio cholerae]|uniref:Uncharacterized protein n=2 Tax=Vibrio TaxID=662 RepID=A0A853QZE1_9VIBR|nr:MULTISPECIES: hypothetical protein [Vibrio]ASG01673.1 hypothetical protein CEG15_16130 [Vibrio anguillarum]ASG01768.1 hypothetical protein CEG15_16740 [Vibrio anguillarum]EGR2241113.1 hypothetical protein [Vibrio cholerae]EGR4118692.1 hypothetical protein [Vibrio cholerae]EJL6493027.1 hypothetical protein [Vibrio cholerae]